MEFFVVNDSAAGPISRSSSAEPSDENDAGERQLMESRKKLEGGHPAQEDSHFTNLELQAGVTPARGQQEEHQVSSQLVFAGSGTRYAASSIPSNRTLPGKSLEPTGLAVEFYTWLGCCDYMFRACIPLAPGPSPCDLEVDGDSLFRIAGMAEASLFGRDCTALEPPSAGIVRGEAFVM